MTGVGDLPAFGGTIRASSHDLVVWPSGPRQLLLKVEPDELTGRRLRRQV